MRAEFRDYVVSLGITAEALLARVEVLYQAAVTLAGNEFDTVFVDEYRDKEGARQFEHMRLLSKKGLCVVVAQFLEEPRFTVGLARDVSTLTIASRSFDFATATEDSRLTVYGEMAHSPDAEFEYKASGKNCETLWRVFHDYLKPRLVKC